MTQASNEKAYEQTEIDLGRVDCLVCGLEVWEMHQGVPMHEGCYERYKSQRRIERERAKESLMV